MQAYEGYFENGQFHTLKQTANIKGRRRAFITILDEPTEDDNIKKLIEEFDRMVDESADEILHDEHFQRLNTNRGIFTFPDEGGEV